MGKSKLKILLIFCAGLVLLSLLDVAAQSNDAAATFEQDYPAVWENALKARKIGMYTLGGWALGNIAISGSLYFNSQGATQRFHEFNVAWNLVNLGLAGAGLYTALHTDFAAMTPLERARDHLQLEKILLTNAGIDVGYIATGFYLMERSKNVPKHQDRLLGYGRSLLLQGGFLLLFDATLYYILNKTFDPLVVL